MSVELVVEVFSPKVQKAIPIQDVVTTIVPEIYTFWRQNRPGIINCPGTRTVFLSDLALNQFFSVIFTVQLLVPPFQVTPSIAARTYVFTQWIGHCSQQPFHPTHQSYHFEDKNQWK